MDQTISSYWIIPISVLKSRLKVKAKYASLTYLDVHEEMMTKGSSETSLILNKLAILKEKTGNRLADLLKRSPVKMFKESADISTSIELENPDSLRVQDMVGRRLSSADLCSPEVSATKPKLTNQHNAVWEDVEDESKDELADIPNGRAADSDHQCIPNRHLCRCSSEEHRSIWKSRLSWEQSESSDNSQNQSEEDEDVTPIEDTASSPNGSQHMSRDPLENVVEEEEYPAYGSSPNPEASSEGVLPIKTDCRNTADIAYTNQTDESNQEDSTDNKYISTVNGQSPTLEMQTASVSRSRHTQPAESKTLTCDNEKLRKPSTNFWLALEKYTSSRTLLSVTPEHGTERKQVDGTEEPSNHKYVSSFW